MHCEHCIVVKLKHFEIRKYPEIGLSDSSKSHRWRCHITEYECDLAIAQNSNRLVSVWILLEVLITCFFLGWLTFLARKSWGSSKFQAFNTLVPIYRLSIWRKSLVQESIRRNFYDQVRHSNVGPPIKPRLSNNL